MYLSFCLRGLRRWKAYHETYGALILLEDHILSDINVGRREIEGVARTVAEAKFA
jgi:uncharacterized protein YjiS (DUF1127 family)